ncbi:MAG: hypothetical protein QM820_39520 [Minicystis sp.]
MYPRIWFMHVSSSSRSPPSGAAASPAASRTTSCPSGVRLRALGIWVTREGPRVSGTRELRPGAAGGCGGMCVARCDAGPLCVRGGASGAACARGGASVATPREGAAL